MEAVLPVFAPPTPPTAYRLSLSSPSSSSLASTASPERVGWVGPEDSTSELDLGRMFSDGDAGMRIVPWRISGMSGIGVGFASTDGVLVADDMEAEFGI